MYYDEDEDGGNGPTGSLHIWDYHWGNEALNIGYDDGYLCGRYWQEYDGTHGIYASCPAHDSKTVGSLQSVS